MWVAAQDLPEVVLAENLIQSRMERMGRAAVVGPSPSRL